MVKVVRGAVVDVAVEGREDDADDGEVEGGGETEDRGVLPRLLVGSGKKLVGV